MPAATQEGRLRKGIHWWAVPVLLLAVTGSALAVVKQKFLVSVYIKAAAQEVSSDGFVDGSNVWIRDSVSDLKKAMDGKEFTPNKTCPGTRARYKVVDNYADADLVLTVAARGTSATDLGQRTTMKFYNGVLLADTVPTVGVTRWVSVILSVANYQKELLAWHTNKSNWSAGAWTADAKLLGRIAACWVMVNEKRIRERQGERDNARRP